MVAYALMDVENVEVEEPFLYKDAINSKEYAYKISRSHE